ncbi:hypothetical protein LTR49_016876 [Elasticomyces elasticus]|nr:hypothetical protein LTR49_016876 [Elasticomyces elasticus]
MASASSADVQPSYQQKAEFIGELIYYHLLPRATRPDPWLEIVRLCYGIYHHRHIIFLNNWEAELLHLIQELAAADRKNLVDVPAGLVLHSYADFMAALTKTPAQLDEMRVLDEIVYQAESLQSAQRHRVQPWNMTTGNPRACLPKMMLQKKVITFAPSACQVARPCSAPVWFELPAAIGFTGLV